MVKIKDIKIGDKFERKGITYVITGVNEDYILVEDENNKGAVKKLSVTNPALKEIKIIRQEEVSEEEDVELDDLEEKEDEDISDIEDNDTDEQEEEEEDVKPTKEVKKNSKPPKKEKAPAKVEDVDSIEVDWDDESILADEVCSALWDFEEVENNKEKIGILVRNLMSSNKYLVAMSALNIASWLRRSENNIDEDSFIEIAMSEDNIKTSKEFEDYKELVSKFVKLSSVKNPKSSQMAELVSILPKNILYRKLMCQMIVNVNGYGHILKGIKEDTLQMILDKIA